jgi:hypothetical protein
MQAISPFFVRPVRPSLPWCLWMVGFVAACFCGAASGLALCVTVLFADSPNVNWSRVWLSICVRCVHFGLLIGASIWGTHRLAGAWIALALIASVVAMFCWPDGILVTPLELLPLGFFATGSILRIMRERRPNRSSCSMPPVLTPDAAQEPRRP